MYAIQGRFLEFRLDGINKNMTNEASIEVEQK